ncbi:MAG: transposase [Lewinellaceae bacterium]|nr:transposase [Lewinellaceae bacterium]
MQQLKLIQLYFYVCQEYEEVLKWHCQRFSQNSIEPLFSDCELLTTYLFAVGYEQRFQVKQIHRYIHDHWLSWFPHLPAYQTYNIRLNRLVATFPVLVGSLLQQMRQNSNHSQIFSLTDSMPIMTCSNKRKAKVALELCNKGYSSVKKRHYYGLKLHAIGFLNPGALPVPEYLLIGPASEHDISAQHSILETLQQRAIVGDKAFQSKKLERTLNQNSSVLFTPVAYHDDIARSLRKFTQAADDLYSAAVSSLRQPIESFFNWLIEKTDIQRASKVRSLSGLLVHVFGKIAAAFLPTVMDVKLNP